MTTLLFRDDPYLREATARIVSIEPAGGVVLDRTPFYPQGGGQPGDSGRLMTDDGRGMTVSVAKYGPDRATVVHQPADDMGSLAVGDQVRAAVDWDLRLKRMRVHTALHVLTTVLPFPVTGGAIGDGDGRLDFDIPVPVPDRAEVESRLNALIEGGAAVTTRWITDDELLANPGLVKTMSVKPPMGTGHVRLVEIAGIDLQPCGGTHVADIREIGRVAITAIESKGKQNRRVRLALAG